MMHRCTFSVPINCLCCSKTVKDDVEAVVIPAQGKKNIHQIGPNTTQTQITSDSDKTKKNQSNEMAGSSKEK